MIDFEAFNLDVVFGSRGPTDDRITGEVEVEFGSATEFDVDEGEDGVVIQFWEEADD